MMSMSRIGTISVVDDRTTRNLSQGGFGNMAITKVKSLHVKLEDDLYNAVQEYAKTNEMDASKVSRLALKNFLGLQRSPVNVKKGIVKTT